MRADDAPFVLPEVVAIRFKKLDQQFLSRNYPTPTAEGIYRQQGLPGLEEIAWLTVGIVPNADWTDYSGVFLTCPKSPSANNWVLDITSGTARDINESKSPLTMHLNNQDNDASDQERRPPKKKVPRVNPEMLVLARESRGLTRQELADSLQIPQSRLSRIEDGFSDLTDELCSWLERVLRYPIMFYAQDRLIEGARPTFYRKYSSLSKFVLRHAVAE